MQSVATLAVAIAAFALSSSALAQGSPAPSRSRLFVHATVGAGVGSYWQINYADRDALGVPVEASLGVGYALSERLVIGGYAAATPWFATNVHGGSHTTIGASPVGHAGFMLDFLPRGRNGVFALEGTLGWGGGGGEGLWGGMGPVVSLAPALRFAHTGSVHIGVYSRVTYGQWFWFDNASALRPVVMSTTGIDWSFF